jgi:hypothetical protein
LSEQRETIRILQAEVQRVIRLNSALSDQANSNHHLFSLSCTQFPPFNLAEMFCKYAAASMQESRLQRSGRDQRLDG